MLRWVFGADISPFKRGLEEMRGEVKSFSGSMKGMLAGAFGGAAAVTWARGMFEHLGRVQDLADRLGISAESVQRIGEAAKLSGSDLETAVKSVGKLTRSLVEAEGGSDEMNQALATLGVTADEMRRLTPEQQLVAMARGFENAKDRGLAYDAVLKLMGRSGEAIIPMLAQGADQLAQQMGDASIASNSAARAIADLGDQIDKLKAGSTPVFGSIVQWLLAIGNFGGSVAYAIGSAFSMAFRGIKGDFKSLDQFKAEFSSRKSAVNEAFTERHNQIFGKFGATPNGAPAPPANDDPAGVGREKAEKAKVEERERLSLAEQRKKIEEDIGKLQEEARLNGLTLEEKITDAQRRRLEAITKRGSLETWANNTSDPDLRAKMESGALEAKKQELEIEKEIGALRKEKAEKDAKAKEDAEKLGTDLVNVQAREAEMRHRMELGRMSDDDRLKALKGDKAASDERADKLEGTGKTAEKIKAAEERMRGLSIQDEIDSIIEKQQTKRKDDLETAAKELERLQGVQPVIATSSLQSIGGGGSANLFTSESTGQRMVDLLRVIADNTARRDGGSPPKSAPLP